MPRKTSTPDDLPESEREAFDAFTRHCLRRLEQGHREYGGGSYDKDEDELAREVDEEILDAVNWLFILWNKRRAAAVAQHIPRFQTFGGDWVPVSTSTATTPWVALAEEQERWWRRWGPFALIAAILAAVTGGVAYWMGGTG